MDSEQPQRPEVAGDSARQIETLEALSGAVHYRRWLADLALPHLGDDPLEVGSGIGDYAAEWADRGLRITASEADPVRRRPPDRGPRAHRPDHRHRRPLGGRRLQRARAHRGRRCRFSTAAAISRRSHRDGADRVLIATGADFARGPLAAKRTNLLMIVPPKDVRADADAAAYLDAPGDDALERITLVGGRIVLSSYQQWQLDQIAIR